MAFYLYQVSYGRDPTKAMIGNPTDRSVEARKLVEGLGGKLHQMFFSFGEFDMAAIIETPDAVSMAAGSMVIAGVAGAAKVKTTPLLTMDEAKQAMAKAGVVTGYKPPAG